MPVMPGMSCYTLEHGLQIEDNHAKEDRSAVYHLFRYWWAWSVIRRWLRDRTITDTAPVVWDLGCGTGFGCRIMAEQHPSCRIVGVDNDAAAIKYARDTYGAEAPNVLYLQTDLDKYGFKQIPRDYHDPDFIVSFETIEFLRHRDLFLDDIATSLPSTGSFLFATDHYARTVCDRRPEWTLQHLHYDTLTIMRILKRHFELVIPSSSVEFPELRYKQQVDRLIEGYTVGRQLFCCRHGK